MSFVLIDSNVIIDISRVTIHPGRTGPSQHWLIATHLQSIH